MDFWAQHKDFVLKVLAGFGVFLVALIARGITYGDELENAAKRNSTLSAKIRRMKIAGIGNISALESNAAELKGNASAILDEIGWNAADEGLELKLVERALRNMRRFRNQGDAAVAEEAQLRRAAIRDDTNGGFGQLRLMVRDDMLEEAGEKNIALGAGIGFESVIQLDDEELLKYLLQLELASRLVRYAIDARVDSLEGIRITERAKREVIPGANPEFLREYPVLISFRASQKETAQILNRLENESPRVPLRSLRVDRETRPPDTLRVELTTLAVAANPEVPFVLEEKEEG
ncbi:MAG: hypothetical protein ACYTEZ_00320 [Planctomycetota bacterium]